MLSEYRYLYFLFVRTRIMAHSSLNWGGDLSGRKKRWGSVLSSPQYFGYMGAHGIGDPESKRGGSQLSSSMVARNLSLG